jgi:hypothetical protein
VAAYYLDDRLSLAEGTCRFPANGMGQVAVQEGFYVIAIRRSGQRECLFRFSSHDRGEARSMLESLNRTSTQAQTPVP